jgi:predicted PurR-regulated permease PerM
VTAPTHELSRFEQTARIAGVTLLAIGTFFVLRPFLAAILFAVVLCLSTWPAYAWLRARLGERPSAAALVSVLLLAVVIALPVALAAQSLVVHSGQVIEWIRAQADRSEGVQLPGFFTQLPFVGASLEHYWQDLAGNREEWTSLAKRMADPAKGVLLTLGQAAGEGLIQVLVAIFVAFFLYRDGEDAAELLRGAVARLAGIERGDSLVVLAQNTVRGVVHGLIGTAAAQAIVALAGFLVAGVPGALLLAALTFILSLVPLGPVLIWGGAAAWLYAKGDSGWAIFMVIYGVAVISSVDNIVKPMLMSRAGGHSMLLVVLGVFGGAIAFGFTGLFVGPVLLAVSWSLTRAWLASESHRDTPGSGPAQEGSP